jgi:hypothetical protein
VALGRTAQLRKFLHRHRRVLGSISAALAVLLFFAALRSTPQVTATGEIIPTLNQDQVAVPVTLRSSAISAAVKIGDTVDLIAAQPNGFPQVLATGALIIDSPGAGGFSSTNSAVIVVAVDHRVGTELAAYISPDISVVVTQR